MHNIFKDKLLFIFFAILLSSSLSDFIYAIPDWRTLAPEGFSQSDCFVLMRDVPDLVRDQHYKKILWEAQNIKIRDSKPIDFKLPPLRAGTKECYYATNPSIEKNKDGYDVLCRTVNYSHRGGKDFKSRDKLDQTIRTKNFLLHYDCKFKLLSQQELIECLPRKRENYTWTTQVVGLEDCRLISLDQNRWFLATTYDTHPETVGQSLCKISFQTTQNAVFVDQLFPLKSPGSNSIKCEKNWLPFMKEDELYVLYGYEPFLILHVNPKDGSYKIVVEYKLPLYDFSRFRGSAPPIKFDEGYLLMVHELVLDLERNYLHRFLYLDKNFKIERISRPFTFLHKGIEYCCGMTLDHEGKTCIIPIGYEEQKAFLLFVDLDTIRSMLKFIR
jgi:predicted GH43/DUF377 family glycosyl hydrolase